MGLSSETLNAFMDGPFEPKHAQSGPLAGLTLAVKDIFDIEGQRTGGGNPQMLAESVRAKVTAPAVQALFDAGAAFIGRTQTEELTFSLMGQNAHYPFPINPAARDRVTGGSSSGSAAAVAGGLADIATGSDTGGSVRAPASFCGLVGLRTTHGLIPLDHTMPLAPSMDTFGWFAKDMATYQMVADVMLPAAPAKSNMPRLLSLAVLDALVLGAPEAATYERMVGLVSDTLGPVTNAPALSQSIDDLYWTFRKLQSYEAWAVHGDWISAKERNLGPGVKDRFDFGKSLGCEVATAETPKRIAIRDELAALLGDDGFLVLPTVPGAAPLKDMPFDDLQEYRERALRLLCLSGLAGFPQITLPLATVHGAPFGISLLGPAGSDRQLIALGARVMSANGKA